MHLQPSLSSSCYRVCGRIFAGFVVLLLGACGDQPWNSPYPPDQAGRNILYSSFSERPNHLDPAQSYSSNEIVFTGQIYEPPLQYHFLKRPYQLEPLVATRLPEPWYVDAGGRRLPDTAPEEDIAFSIYDIEIQPGIMYQPHPAFARTAGGEFVYHAIAEEDLDDISALGDFAVTGSRELIAEDFVYQVKRLAHPRLHSPVFGLMSEYIVGLGDYADTLKQALQDQQQRQGEVVYLNLHDYPMTGAEVIDRYRYRIKIRGKYKQFSYWLAMPFFAPVPWEADRFYTQPGMKERNITLDWYPVGTGPYMLTVNNPNRQMVLERNPNFHGERYPVEGSEEDRAAGYLDDAGKPLPMIDKVIYSLEKEAIPYWNKFLQGYYDTSGVNDDSFDQAIQIGMGGDVSLTPELVEKGIELNTAVATSIFYLGFNMLDPVIGGDSERARLLRQAVSIAIDYDEFIAIFANGRGITAQGPVPPGIFGYLDGEAGINPYVYNWTPRGPERKSIEEARQLLVQAGYPNGRDVQTGRPLVLYFDTTASGPDDSARLNWMRKQFQKLDIQLQIRATDYNRFQDKMRKGSAQLFQWGWNADYPDPENFLFLLYGKNSKAEHNGENAANYRNAEYDALFERMKNMPDGAARQEVINRMVGMLRYDAPWVFGFHPKQFVLYHQWYKNAKSNLMANNVLKYKRIDAGLREQKRHAWNQPVVWPLAVIAALLVLAVIPAVIGYRRHENRRVRVVES